MVGHRSFLLKIFRKEIRRSVDVITNNFVVSEDCYSVSRLLIHTWVLLQEWKLEKKLYDMHMPDISNGDNGRTGRGINSVSDLNVDEEAPLISSLRMSHLGRTQISSRDASL